MISPVKKLALNNYPWIKQQNTRSGIVIASRTRMARNIEGFNFPEKADVDSRSELMDNVFEAVEKLPIRKKVYKAEINNLSEKEKKILLERKILTFEAIFDFECGVVVEENENYSILVNEEDHLHIQAIRPGLQLEECWKAVDKVESQLSKFLKFSFSNDFGYLTSSPANIGTGLKVSAYLDLTGSFLTGQLSGMIHAAKVTGHLFEAESGEQDYKGSRFIVSNRHTLGMSEKSIIGDFENFVNDIICGEILARRKVIADFPQRALNHISRSYRILKNSWLLSEDEAFDALLNLRTGINLGLFENLDDALLNELMIYAGDAHLQNTIGKDLMPEELDIARAEYFRKKLAS